MMNEVQVSVETEEMDFNRLRVILHGKFYDFAKNQLMTLFFNNALQICRINISDSWNTSFTHKIKTITAPLIKKNDRCCCRLVAETPKINMIWRLSQFCDIKNVSWDSCDESHHKRPVVHKFNVFCLINLTRSWTNIVLKQTFKLFMIWGALMIMWHLCNGIAVKSWSWHSLCWAW